MAGNQSKDVNRQGALSNYHAVAGTITGIPNQELQTDTLFTSLQRGRHGRYIRQNMYRRETPAQGVAPPPFDRKATDYGPKPFARPARRTMLSSPHGLGVLLWTQQLNDAFETMQSHQERSLTDRYWKECNHRHSLAFSPLGGSPLLPFSLA